MSNESLKKDRFALESMQGYQLRRIKTDFKIAEFERQVSVSHVTKIKAAIMRGELFDNRITVWGDKESTEPYQVIDGQHRLLALQSLYDEGRLQKYDILLSIIHEDGKKAYLNINKGRSLTIADVLKVHDEGQLFFTELKEFCAHYPQKTKLSYSFVAKAFGFGHTGSETVRFHNIGDFVTELKKFDIDNIKAFLGVLREVFGEPGETFMYRQIVFFPLTRIYYQCFETQDIEKFKIFAKRVENDHWIREQARINSRASRETMALLYQYLMNKVPERLRVSNESLDFVPLMMPKATEY